MIDEETRADLRTGVNVDTRGRVRQLRADPRQQRQAGLIQVMGQAVMDDRQNPRIAQQHLIDTARRRVTVIGRQHVGIEQHAQVRQRDGKVLDQAQRLGIDAGQVALAVAHGVAQL
ncbi:hypothetical protein D3C76_1167790 [compost metagenome]